MLKNDISQNELQTMLDQINRGQTAVKSYFQAINEIKSEARAFSSMADPAGSHSNILADCLSLYEDLITQARLVGRSV